MTNNRDAAERLAAHLASTLVGLCVAALPPMPPDDTAKACFAVLMRAVAIVQYRADGTLRTMFLTDDRSGR